MDDFHQRQVPYALSNALNDTGKLFQYRQRAHMATIFTERRKDWVDKNVKITHFATKRELYATVKIEAPGDPSRSDILAKFERDRVKRPIQGSTTAIPVEAMRARTGVIRKGERIGAIGPFTQGAGRLIGKGNKRTFMLDLGGGKKGIFQRVGAGSRKARGIHGPLPKGRDRNLKLLFLLKPSTPITPNLEFVLHARDAVTHFPEFFRSRFAEAMASAR